MTVEELKVRFTASTEEFKAKTDEMKQKLSDVGKIGEKMQKTIDRGMKSSSEKTQRLAKNLSSIGERLNAQSEKLKDAASSVNFYADKMDELKAKSQQQTAAIEAQKAKVAQLKNTYAKVKEVTEKFGTKIPLSEQFEEAEKQANQLEEKIRAVQQVVSSVGKNQKLVFVGDELMSIDKAKEKISQLISEQEEASRKAGEIEKAMSSIGGGNIKFTSNEGMKQLKTDISAAEKQLASLQSEASKTNSEIGSTAQKAANSYKNLEAAGSVFDKLKRKTAEAEEKLKKAMTVTQRFKDRIHSIRDGSVGKITNAFKKAGSAISSALSKLGKIPAALKNIGSHAKSSASHLSKIPSMLKKMAVAAVGLKLIKGIFGQLRSVVSDYISRNEALNARVEGLKNAFGQMLAPAIEIVVSAFEKLMPYLLAIGDAIVEVLTSLSIFSGLKKTSQAVDGVTDSTKALSEAQKELYGFDKITKQSDDKNSSGSSASTPTYTPADIGSVDEIISKLTESINKAMKSIDWDSVKQKAVSFASEVSSAFNQFFSGIDWEAAGKTVGEGLNTINTAINTFLTKTDFKLIGESLGTAVSSGINTINWETIGENFTLGLSSVGKTVQGYAEKMDWSGVATAINSLFSGIDFDAATTELTTGINTAIGGIRTTLQGISWSEIGKTLADAVNGIFKLDWSNIGGLLSDGISGAFQTLASTLENIDWKGLGDSLCNLVKGIEWGNIASSIFESIGAAVGGASALVAEIATKCWQSIKDYFNQYIPENASFGEIASGIFKGISDGFKNIGTWIKENIFQPFIDGFKNAFGIASPAKEMEPMGGYIIDGLKNGIGDIWEKVKEKFTGLLDGIKTWFTEKKTELEGAWNTFTSGIGTVVATVKENYEEFKDGLKAKWDTAVSGISDKTATVIAEAKDALGQTGKDIKAYWNTIKSKTSTLTGKAKDNAKKTATKLKGYWSKVKTKTAILTGKAKDSTGKVASTLKGYWSKVKTKTAILTGKAKDSTATVASTLKDYWSKIYDKTSTLTAKAVESGKSKLKDIKDWWSGIQTKSAELSLSLSDKVSSAFKTVIRNVIDLVNSMIEKVNKVLPQKYEISKIQYPSWAYMAKGGIVDRATPALIGEAGKEAVMPLENNTGWIDELARRISLNISPDNSQPASGKTPVVIPIYIGTRKMTDVFIDDINQRTLTTGRCPIRI